MNRNKGLLALSGTFAAVAVFIAACSDDADRVEFGGSPDAAADAAPVNVAEASAPDASNDVVDASIPYDGAPTPVVCATTPCATDLVAGSQHFCALMSDGAVQCWGDDGYGALGGGPAAEGDGDENATRGTVKVLGLPSAKQLSAAGHSTCAATAGPTFCWGENSKGQLGIRGEDPFSDGDTHFVASGVAMGATITRVDVGLGTTCGIEASGSGWCWGDNAKGQLTKTDIGSTVGPTSTTFAGIAVERIGFSDVTAYALTQDGKLASWGTVAGRPSSLDVDPNPAILPKLSSVVDFAVGPTHACAIDNGDVYCWGRSDAQALCNGLPDAQLQPYSAPLAGTLKAQQIAVGKNNTCVRLTDGTVQCCGSDSHGQLGDTDDAGTLVPAFRSVQTLKDEAVRVATADDTTCALLKDGSVTCWGSNEHGELGGPTKDTLAHSTPAKVTFR